MAFQEILQSVKRAVVGLGVLVDQKDPLSVVTLGTGFIVDPAGWVMTNRHVAGLFMGERDGVFGVRNAIARAVLFAEFPPGKEIPGTGKKAVGGRGAVPCPIVEIAMPPGARDAGLHYNQPPDLALCRINTGNVPYITPLSWLRLGDSSKVREGDEVGICGFPLGLTLPQDERLHQLTPIAQRGIVAAILPWSGLGNPHAFQLDIPVSGGSSGSPVFFTETGEVIGIVFAAPQEQQKVTIPSPEGEKELATISLPTGFSYAVPANRYREQPKPVTKLPDVYHGAPPAVK